MHAPSRAGSVATLLFAAVAGGAVAGSVTAVFIWTFESLIELVWTDLPNELGVDPYGSWYLFVVPATGGLLVGLGQKFLGNLPRPLDETIALWRSGGSIESRTLPGTVYNSLAALVAGGPVGFEAALTNLIGGIASWISGRVGAARSLVRQAWGAERVDERLGLVTTVPYWIAAVSGLLAYRWLPFGSLDTAFRFDDFQGHIGVVDGLVAFAFAAAVAIPVAWAMVAVGRAEVSPFFERSPIVVAIGGALVFAAMAWISPAVLFSGQQDMQHLIGLGNAELGYITVMKWAALVVALYAGWRGGPVFPMFTAVAALGVIVDDLVDIGPSIVMVGGIAAVSVVIAQGRIVVGFVLTLYAAPFSYSGVILVGCIGGAVALAIGNSLGWLPAAQGHAPPVDETDDPVVGVDAATAGDADG